LALNARRRKIAIHTTRSRSASYAASSWKVFQMRLRPPALTITPRDHRGPKEKGQSTETKEDSRSGDGYKKPAKRPAHDHLHAAQNNR
jgi:hypothetical protein